ncbi:MAG: restriction endonuclease [Oscillospiraceae bacterium]|nr:restriction endonuclease [Oscillospiraceae bacterium]MBQ8377567.1 restriction endonuclease [Oscillospiraceae bacterium]MBQ8884126.1 restriction endonuclease [Oscillospiraceae bacterium]
MLFKPRDFSSKLILTATALIGVAFEFEGLSNIVKAIFNEESKMPKFWWIYIIVLIIVLICAYAGRGRTYSITQLDNMEGHEFEYACADILRANGFKNVEVTRGSGDFGVDVLAEKKGIKYAIQCKCYSHKLDNTPIQEVIGGLACYGCTKGAVMTNQYFTEPAKELARINGVELWDRDVIQKMSEVTTVAKPQNKIETSNDNTSSEPYVDDEIFKALQILINYDIVDNAILVRQFTSKLSINFNHAKKLLVELEQCGFIGPLVDFKRRIFVTKDNYYEKYKELTLQ